MTRSKIRENVFKMLFRVEFHDKSELAEQMELLNDELTNPTDEERQYIDEKCSAIIEHMAELDALIDEKAGRPIVWQRLIWQLSDWQFMR